MRTTFASISSKLLSTLFAATLAFGLVPVAAFADDDVSPEDGSVPTASEGSTADGLGSGIDEIAGSTSAVDALVPAEGEAAGEEGAIAGEDADSSSTIPASDILSQEMPLDMVVAQAESTKSYFLAQTLESTRTVPVVSAKLPVAGEETEEVVGSFSYRGITYAVEPGGEGVAIVAADHAKLPSDFIEAQTIVLPSVVSPDGIDSYSVTRIAEGAFSSLTLAAQVAEDVSASDDDETEEDVAMGAPIEGEGASDEEASLDFAINAITIPASIATIEDDAFAGFDALQYVIVSDDNPEYAMYDGCLYDKPLSSLLLIPEGRLGAVRIAPSVTNVDPEVFSHCPSVDALVADAGSAAYQLLSESDSYSGENMPSMRVMGPSDGTTPNLSWSTFTYDASSRVEVGDSVLDVDFLNKGADIYHLASSNDGIVSAEYGAPIAIGSGSSEIIVIGGIQEGAVRYLACSLMVTEPMSELALTERASSGSIWDVGDQSSCLNGSQLWDASRDWVILRNGDPTRTMYVSWYCTGTTAAETFPSFSRACTYAVAPGAAFYPTIVKNGNTKDSGFAIYSQTSLYAWEVEESGWRGWNLAISWSNGGTGLRLTGLYEEPSFGYNWGVIKSRATYWIRSVNDQAVGFVDTNWHPQNGGSTTVKNGFAYRPVSSVVGDSLVAVSRTGYTFDGWYNSQTNMTSSTRVTKDTLIKDAQNCYAKWIANQYALSFDANGGSGGQSESVTATYDAAMPAISTEGPVRVGYDFGGWYDTAASSGGTQYYTADGASARTWNKTAAATLYARWTKSPYVARLHANDGTEAVAEHAVSYDVAVPSATVPKRYGYVFAGYWTKQNDGAKDELYFDEDGAYVRDSGIWKGLTSVDLYACWMLMANLEVPINAPGAVTFAVDRAMPIGSDAAGALAGEKVEGLLRSRVPQEVPIASVELEALQEDDGTPVASRILGVSNAAKCGVEVSFGSSTSALLLLGDPMTPSPLWEPASSLVIPAATSVAAGTTGEDVTFDSLGNLARMGELKLTYAMRLLPGFDVYKMPTTDVTSEPVARIVFTVDLTGLVQERF